MATFIDDNTAALGLVGNKFQNIIIDLEKETNNREQLSLVDFVKGLRNFNSNALDRLVTLKNQFNLKNNQKYLSELKT